MQTDTKKEWEAYRAKELAAVTPLLKMLGYILDAEQPHTGGERYLMQAVTTTSGRKLILLGTRKEDGVRVVIKIASDVNGMRELEHERVCRDTLPKLGFAYSLFTTPEELLFEKRDGRLISIQKYIPQQKPFLERPLKEQFNLALQAFKAQEGAHATTYGHSHLVAKTYGSMNAHDYIKKFDEFKSNILQHGPDELVPRELLDKASEQLHAGEEDVERYCGFLTHTDFVPHNIRIAHDEIYLLDTSSIRFGNKYEGWARFLNFMTLYNPELADALTEYVQLNRTPEELRALKLMRIYRLGEIIWYYVNTLDKCSDDDKLCTLNQYRIGLWTEVLTHVLRDETVPAHYLDAYREKRDTLRSADEKARQQGLH